MSKMIYRILYRKIYPISKTLIYTNVQWYSHLATDCPRLRFAIFVSFCALQTETVRWLNVADVGPCRDSFVSVVGYVPQNFNDGQVSIGVRSPGDCETQCRRNTNCMRFVFITNVQLVGDPNRVCYLFFSRDRLFREQPGGTIYFRRKCVPITCGAVTDPSKSPLQLWSKWWG